MKQVSAVILALLIATASTGCGAGPSPTGGGPPASLTLTTDPAALTAYPASNFQVIVTATASGTSAVPTITLGSLPSGLTTTASFPMNVPPTGAMISFSVASAMATGSYAIQINGTAGTATTQKLVAFTVASGVPPQASFVLPPYVEFGVPAGGSTSAQIQVLGSSSYEISLSVSGMPSGVSASFNPQIVEPGQTFTVTLSASASAPVAQNVQWNLIGTPAASVSPLGITLLVDVTAASGVGWTNRTSYISTRASPFSAVYDSAHQLIYSSNPTWNRIDVISNATHSLVQSLPIGDPRGLDLSIDGKTVWVATGSQVMYGIDTTTFKPTRYQLPRSSQPASPSGSSWEGQQVLALADGTVMLVLSPATGEYAAIWDPIANTLTPMSTPSPQAQWEIVIRSGDGTRVFSVGSDSAEICFSYNVLTKTLGNAVALPGEYGMTAAANQDGSRIAISDFGGFNLYDGNFDLIGSLPGDGGASGGGSLFSSDGNTFYEETSATVTGVPAIVTIDVATRQPTGLAPAMVVIPVATGSNMLGLPLPFAIDNTGMLLGIHYHGIAFDDAMSYVNYGTYYLAYPTFMQHMDVYSGPLEGGTTSGGFGNAFSLTPDVYYGATKGIAAQYAAQIISPPASVPGPVDVKMLFPDGIEVFDPQFFTYGTYPQDVILSGGPPQGNVPSTLDAFGLPLDPSQDTVTIGTNRATITSTTTQYPPFTGEQTDMFLSYTVPAGSPGWADVTVTTPNGTGKLPKAFFYAQSVTDFAIQDSPSFVLYDESRNQVYLSAGDHIDVFSLTSNSFVSPLQPPSLGTNKQFEGLALTPDKKSLLAADLLDGSLAVIDPDTPTTSFVIGLPQSTTVTQGCNVGPLFVAADNQGEAIVVTGGVVGINCGPGTASQTYVVNLASKATTLNLPGCFPAAYVDAIGDGSLIVLGGSGALGVFQIYSAAQKSCVPPSSPPRLIGAAAAADGDVFAVDRALVDPNGNIVGRMGAPPVFYPGANSAGFYFYSPYQDGALQNPTLNDAGSLYFWAYPSYVDIVDVQHGMPRLRLSLSETVSNTVSPMAIDGGGQNIFLITNKGLTIVDLGVAPLSVGHLSQLTANAGTQVQVRGSGFESGISASVSNSNAATSFIDQNTLTFIVPIVSPGLQDLTLHNPDGTTYTLNNALTVK